MIKCIPFFKTCNRQVDYIDKSYCSLTTVPEDIMRFSKTLEELYLNSNHIRELPKSFFRLIKLRKLSLHDNEFKVLPPDIGNFIYLVELDASKNEFEEIPDAIRYCKQLQILDFSSTFVNYLSPGVTQLHNLTTLYLNFNAMQELPSDFGSLVNLQNLELRENDLRFLPHSFGNLKNLVRLDLGHNFFQILPPLIGQLLNLEELWLDKNELRRLPGEIGNLRNLQSLDVTENKLEFLPDEIVLMESLVDLHLSKNHLEQLPDNIGHLCNLTILKLDQNNLLDLNPTIGGCSSLQELMLTENSLSYLPATIGNLTNLSILNLDLNKLEELPPTICNLTKLGIISLRNNNLTYLPNEMGQLKKLHVLDVANNQLQYLPYSITSLNLEALWLSENQSHPLLKFQTDVDPKTGNKVLTCFLLPQQKESCDSRSIENLLDNTLQRINSINWEQPRQQSQVKFYYENEGAEEDDELLGNVQSFVRHDTPHPKELKARHQKLFTKDNNESNTTTASINQSANDQAHEDSVQPAKSESESSEASSVIIRQNYDNSSNLIANKTSTVQNLNEIDNVNQYTLDNYLDAQGTSYQQMNQFHHYPDEQQVDYQNELNQDDYTMDGKHVIFNQEYNENEDANDQQKYEPQNKLHRRDTPHHLKNKRINSMTNKADADKVASILDKLNNQMNYDEDTTAMKTSSSSSVNNNNLMTNNLNSYNNVNNLDYQTSTSTLNYQPMEPCEVKQLRFHLTRSPQLGLGLSIAGGKGSTPYKNNDESIFVSNVADKSPAYLAGLQKGDKILSVNDISLEGAEHFRAVRVFKQAGEQFSVLISREVPISMYTSSSNTNLNQMNSNLNTSIASSFLPSYSSISQINNNGGIRNLAFEDKQPQQQSSSFTPSSSSVPVVHTETSTSSLVNNIDKDSKIQYATLIRGPCGIGITVAYDDLNNICIDSVQKSADSKVQINDRLVSINGKDIKKLNMTIEEVEAILNSGERFIRIVVERN